MWSEYSLVSKTKWNIVRLNYGSHLILHSSFSTCCNTLNEIFANVLTNTGRVRCVSIGHKYTYTCTHAYIIHSQHSVQRIDETIHWYNYFRQLMLDFLISELLFVSPLWDRVNDQAKY